MRRFFGPTGSVSRITIESRALENNLLGDPLVRVVDIYLPAGHDGEGLPLLVDLVGFTGSGLSHTNWVGFRENLPERLDRLIGEQKMPPVVVAFPDCFTRLGGNQYINSLATGAWEDFLLHEMLPAVERRYGCGGTGAAASSARAPAGTERLRTPCATPTSGPPRPVIPAIWGSSCVICRHAGGIACARRQRQLDRAMVATARNRQEAWGGCRQGDQCAGDGRQLRPRPDAVPRHKVARHDRHL